MAYASKVGTTIPHNDYYVLVLPHASL
ncbi:uncharacterized protein G2W53_010510 [Senna tora]|uniref:Uncharacterized protein n=1 Tax=Senna tora TaxID=362788 RepID=A0A835CBG6_9FABA|nr:uncharacterized protein G2W53_010510 [Senna tora]